MVKVSEQCFGDVLRSHRERLQLTQEDLAQRAALGVRTVRELEAGRVLRPRGQSLRLLADALALDGQARAQFVSLAYHGAKTSEPTPPPRQLPADIAGFIGRQDVLEALDNTLTDHAALPTAAVGVVGITGMAGIGKTAVAVHWAHRVASRFPDGTLYVDLHGCASATPLRPIAALSRFLRALGVSEDRVPVDSDEVAALYRSVLATRRVLVLLDNAASAEQVRPLLPGTAGSFVLVTSRNHLTGLVAHDGAQELSLSGLRPAESRELLAHVLGAKRVAADVWGASRLARLCVHLPLALRIAAANLATNPDGSIAEYADNLAHDRLSALTSPGDEGRAVRSAFDLSYGAQPLAARRMFRLLGLVPGPDIAIEAAAALADAPATRAAALLDHLARVHLVERSPNGHYGLHDLLRHYAQDRVRHEPDRDDATNRLLDYYLAATNAAADRMYPYMFRVDVGDRINALHPGFADGSAATAWLDAERQNVIAAIGMARRPRPAAACALAVALRGYLWFRGHSVDALHTAEVALAAAAADGTIEARAGAEITAAMTYYNAGDHPRAAAHGEAAVTLARRAGIKNAEAPALANLAPILLRTGDPTAAVERILEAVAVARQCARRTAEGALLAELALAYRELGRLGDAEANARAAVVINRECGSLVNEGRALAALGAICYELGDLDEAATHMQRSLDLARETADRPSEAPALAVQAAVTAAQGRLAEAADAADAALDAMAEQDHWTEVECRNTLGIVMRYLGRYHDAVAQHMRALELIGNAPHCAPAVIALIGLSEAHRALDEMPEAATCAREAVQISSTAGYRVLEGQAHVEAAEIALVNRQCESAAAHAAEAVAIQQATGHRLGEARAKFVLGHADSHEGAKHWHGSLAIFEHCGAKGEAIAVSELLRHRGAQGSAAG
jgi:tetratricopeptide (TPR) repeat protein/transcriptional regulator with XRE-family HTH domain